MAKAKKKAAPRVHKRPPVESTIDVERVAAVLAAPEHSTRAAQAKALGVVDRTLRRWLTARPEILPRALALAREASAATMITGYRRLEGIVAKGPAKNCIAALKLLAQLRGEFIEKRDVALSGAVSFIDPRLAAILESIDEEELRGLIARGTRSAGPGGGGGTRAPKGK